MKPFVEMAHTYAENHSQSFTRYAHAVGIPLVLFSAMVLFGLVRVGITNVGDVSLATLGTLGLIVWYCRLNWRLAVFCAPVMICLLWIANLFTASGPTQGVLWTFVVTLIAGLGVMITSHLMEGKRPSFLGNPEHLALAPLYITAELVFLSGHMQALKAEIEKAP